MPPQKIDQPGSNLCTIIVPFHLYITPSTEIKSRFGLSNSTLENQTDLEGLVWGKLNGVADGVVVLMPELCVGNVGSVPTQ